MDSGYNVCFPKLSIELYIRPVALRSSFFTVYWYGLLVCASFAFGFLYSLHKAKGLHIDKDKFTDVSFFSIIASVVGARLYYVVFCADSSYYFKYPEKIFAINEGGLAVYGGIILACITGFFVSKIKKLDFLKVLDVSSFGIILGQSIGRWGNFFNQEAFGTRTTWIFGMYSESTGNVTVHPCFLYESVWCFLGLLFLEINFKRNYRFSGYMFILYIIWYCSGRFFIESLRTDSLMIPYTNLRVSQILSVIMVLICLIILLIKKLRHEPCYKKK